MGPNVLRLGKRGRIPTKSPIDNDTGFKDDESFTNSDDNDDKTEEPINNRVAENSISVSHVAATEDLPILDCSTQSTCLMLIPYLRGLVSSCAVGFEIWHVELNIGLVLLAWPDFAESSEVANEQVLASLQPLDYLVVAFLPGVSEELLFRGALLPLFGIDWKSVLLVAVISGVLHLGSGGKYSFAVWYRFYFVDRLSMHMNSETYHRILVGGQGVTYRRPPFYIHDGNGNHVPALVSQLAVTAISLRRE
ncbi:Type II CAAX prenyl endopeptidase Rce1-like [Dillenia turbinata]|uniref:Type II CAAX prenyl endopeptidase Rce1-like n=1 Tax=Dillenia turbinata TaxID=194707 RepID=A0AAN8Z4G8_9MAGN